MRFLVLALLLAACSSVPEPRLQLAPVIADTAIRTSVARSVELREVSLPYYAQGEQIGVEQADGSVALINDVLWADLPPRALTLRLSQTLAARLPDVAVAAEPWPLLTRADLRVEIQVARAVGQIGGEYALQGQYFIVALNRGTFEQAESFTITQPAGGDTIAGIATAQSAAFDALADLIIADIAALSPGDIGR